VNVADRSQLESRWRGLCAAAGLTGTGDADEAGRWLLDAYGAANRAYHNLAHLAHCLAEFDAVRTRAADPAAAELGIWFHDSVYDPARADNEERSADWARGVLAYLGAGEALTADVAAIVLATRHAGPPPAEPADAALVADADLAILGQPPAAFEAFEQAIRAATSPTKASAPPGSTS
jgi:predicted metal-dependent HD superfamily phosphohydrolase